MAKSDLQKALFNYVNTTYEGMHIKNIEDFVLFVHDDLIVQASKNIVIFKLLAKALLIPKEDYETFKNVVVELVEKNPTTLDNATVDMGNLDDENRRLTEENKNLKAALERTEHALEEIQTRIVEGASSEEIKQELEDVKKEFEATIDEQKRINSQLQEKIEEKDQEIRELKQQIKQLQQHNQGESWVDRIGQRWKRSRRSNENVIQTTPASPAPAPQAPDVHVKKYVFDDDRELYFLNLVAGYLARDYKALIHVTPAREPARASKYRYREELLFAWARGLEFVKGLCTLSFIDESERMHKKLIANDATCVAFANYVGLLIRQETLNLVPRHQTRYMIDVMVQSVQDAEFTLMRALRDALGVLRPDLVEFLRTQ
jgi:uncharacterized protein YukE